MGIKLKDITSHVIVGVRIHMSAKKDNKVKVKILNRDAVVIKASDASSLWYDIAFCDAEVIFVQQQQILEIEFISDDPKQCPICVYKCQIFIQSTQDFGINNKLAKHEKELLSKLDIEKSVTKKDLALEELL